MLTLDHVSKTYRVGTFGGETNQAVRDVSFSVEAGEVLSLIGESGSGKSTIGKMILRLLAVTDGSITVDGTDISTLKKAQLRPYYRDVQAVFQDPFSSCNPTAKVDHIFGMLRSVYFRGLSDAEWSAKIAAALADVNLDAGQVLHKYPHQLSGGQVQRLLIARALLLETRYLVADEIISMLDASTRIDVLNLLGDLKRRGLGILFITHDLALGNYISDRTVILRRGRIVEMGTTRKVFEQPLHPYTRNLIASVPQLHKTWRDLEGELALADEVRHGCAYHVSPPAARPAPVDGVEPPLARIEDDHLVACAHIDEPAGCPDAGTATAAA